MYPSLAIPTSSEPFIIEDKTIQIPKCNLSFKKWNGIPIKETFGGKAVIEYNNKPMFAELAIMNLFLENGWNAKWIETYGRPTNPFHLSEWKDDKYKNQIHNPITDEYANKILQGIAEINSKTFSGCWDVIAWKQKEILFIESKRTKQDKIRQSQINCLASALQYGLSPQNFLVAQWNLIE